MSLRPLSRLLALLALAAAGCSGSGGYGYQGTGAGHDLSYTFAEPDLSLPRVPDLSVECAPCNVDADCEASCPPAASGVYCCDTATNTCYANPTGSCQAPAPDLGMTGPYP